MTLLFIDGMAEMGTRIKAGWVGGTTRTTATGRDGSTQGAAQWGTVGTLAIAPSTTVVVGMAVKTQTGQPVGRFPLFASDSGGAEHLTVTFDATYHPQLRLGSTNGAVIATSTAALAEGVWHYLEAKATIGDTTGNAVVRLDEVEVINYTGDTRNGGTSTLIDSIKLGMAGGAHSVDDFYVLNTSGTAPLNDFLGDMKVERRVPDGNGTASMFIGSDGNSVDNYLLVDENPANTSDYAGRVSTATGDKDIYAIADLVTTTGSVYAAQPLIYAAKSDAGTGNIRILAKGASTIATSASIPLTTTYLWYDGPLLTEDPDGNPWSHARVNSLQAGAEVT